MASTPKAIAALIVARLVATAAPARADGRHDRSDRARRGAIVSRHAAPVVVAPRGRPYVYRPFRPYVYRPSYAYGYRPYYGYYAYRPYLYAPAFGFSVYFGRPYGVYAQPPAYGYYSVVPGRAYGAVRIAGAPGNAELYVDGYYSGLAGDNDRTVNLEAGPHHVEVQSPGEAPVAFDVRVESGQTVNYRAYPVQR